MSTEDKAANKADEFKGKAKEFIGDKTGNRDLEPRTPTRWVRT